MEETIQSSTSASTLKQKSLQNKKVALDILASVARYEKTNQVEE